MTAVKKGTRTKKTARDFFGDAFKALSERKFDKAAAAFEKIINNFPDEEDVVARAKTLQSTCEKAMLAKQRKATRQTAEQHFDMGVFHHNNRDFAAATDRFQKALKSVKGAADHIHYAWAATKVQQGELDDGLEELKKAAKIDEANLCYAANDPDFEPLAEHEKFRKLVGSG
jgi:tetratricopeptide (TPR) repeat protein